MSVASSRKPEDFARPPDQNPKYEADFYGWALRQAALIRAGRWTEVDAENLAGEIEGLGKSEFSALVGFYRLILLHMLKWEHQPNFRGRSWATSIAIHRLHATKVLNENPSLKPRLAEALSSAYEDARLEAVKETGLRQSTFPEHSPYGWDEMMHAPYEFE